MKRLIFALLFLVSCQSVPIYKVVVPAFSCPEFLYLPLEDNLPELTPEENLLIALNNISKINRMIDNRMAILECYTKNVNNMRNKGEQEDEN